MKSLAVLLLGGSFLLALPDESKCPISGKAGKDDVFLNVNGKKVHFCCDNCPKAYKKKINLVEEDGEKTCPLSGKAASDEHTVIVTSAKKVAFCCNNCPKGFAKRHKFEIKDTQPGKCPLSGKEAKDDDGTSLVVNGNKVFFCCKNCPKAYLKKLGVSGEPEDACPISGRPVKAETVQVFVESKVVGFCCPKCKKSFSEKNFKDGVYVGASKEEKEKKEVKTERL